MCYILGIMFDVPYGLQGTFTWLGHWRSKINHSETNCTRAQRRDWNVNAQNNAASQNNVAMFIVAGISLLHLVWSSGIENDHPLTFDSPSNDRCGLLHIWN